jgi:hypothetical protein
MGYKKESAGRKKEKEKKGPDLNRMGGLPRSMSPATLDSLPIDGSIFTLDTRFHEAGMS